jgi:two-component system phosphate regulon sensor histidine kinase PhoR
VFDRFYRADPSRSMVEGSGLGLAIAKWIAANHQAELSVSSEEGKGSTFRIVFPPDAGVRKPVEALREELIAVPVR